MRRRTTRAVLMVLGLVLVFFLTSLGSALWTVFRGIRSDLPGPVPVPRPGQHVNILFLGLDAPINDGKVDLNAPLRGSRSRTDTMILISLDRESNEVGLISIPRDTRIQLPGHGWGKINAAHVYGGPGLAMQVVEDMMGVPVHYYFRTNYHGVEAVVDILGGVEIDVEQDMDYKDPYQNLVIDLKAGRQVLDGDEALQYLRYRNNGGDIGRIGRQQKFVGALVDRVLSFGTFFRANSLAREGVKHVDTNMSTSDIFGFALATSRIEDPAIEMLTVPGKAEYISDDGGPPLSYWIPDLAELHELVDRLVWGIDREANAGLRVRVLNGVGKQGLAARVARELRADGFEVVEIGNTAERPANTRVISHVSDGAASDKVMRSIMRSAPDAAALRELNDGAPYDITVIIGKDFSAAQL